MSTPLALGTDPSPNSPPDGPSGSEYAALSRLVRKAGLLERRRAWYGWRIVATFLALVGGWVLFVLVGDSWWQLAVAVFLAVVFAQLGFLGHDAGHRQIFRSRRGQLRRSGVLLRQPGHRAQLRLVGDKHNRHHAHPNTEDDDPDIMSGVLAFTGGQARAAARASRASSSATRPGCSSRCCCWRGSACTSSSIRALTSRGAAGDRAGRDRPARPCTSRPTSSVGVPGAVAGQGGGVHPRAAGPVRVLPGLLVRPQPQGHADAGARATRWTSCAARC